MSVPRYPSAFGNPPCPNAAPSLLSQDLLAYGRLGHAAISVSSLDLCAEIAAAQNRLAPEIHARNAEVLVEPRMPRVLADSGVRLKVGEDRKEGKGVPGAPVSALPSPTFNHTPDSAVLSEILVNLLRNAITFVAPCVTPRVRVRAEPVEAGFVRTWIEDNGIGIDPEHHERVFRVFERLRADPVYMGTGIGLAIVRKGTERMGGHTGVESTPGVGSRFWVELPTAPAMYE